MVKYQRGKSSPDTAARRHGMQEETGTVKAWVVQEGKVISVDHLDELQARFSGNLEIRRGKRGEPILLPLSEEDRDALGAIIMAVAPDLFREQTIYL